YSLPPWVALHCPWGRLELNIRNEDRWTGRRRTVDHVADRPPSGGHLFDGPKELRTARPRQRARREPNVAVGRPKGAPSRQTGIDELDRDSLPADKAVRAGEPDLKPVPRNHTHRRGRDGKELGVVQVEQDDVRGDLHAGEIIRWEHGRGRPSNQRGKRRREVRTECFRQRDIIKRRRRTKGDLQGTTRVISQETKRWLLGLNRNGVRRFHRGDGPRRRWSAGRPNDTAGTRRSDAIVVQEIRPEQLVIRDRAKLALTQ